MNDETIDKMTDLIVSIAADLYGKWEEERSPEKAKGLDEFLNEISKKLRELQK